MWAVPLTQMEPWGFMSLRHSRSQRRVKSWSASGPLDSSHLPLFTLTIFPAWHVIPSLERK